MACPGAVTIAVLPWSELIGGVPCPRSRRRDHEFRGSTAVDRETYAGHVCRVVRREKERGARDLRGLAESTQRHLGGDFPAVLGGRPGETRRGQRRIDHA